MRKSHWQAGWRCFGYHSYMKYSQRENKIVVTEKVEQRVTQLARKHPSPKHLCVLEFQGFCLARFFRFNFRFFSNTKVDYLLLGYITTVTYAEHLTCSGASLVQDKRSAGLNAPPTYQSNQLVLLENDITIYERSWGVHSRDQERVSGAGVSVILALMTSHCSFHPSITGKYKVRWEFKSQTCQQQYQ